MSDVFRSNDDSPHGNDEEALSRRSRGYDPGPRWTEEEEWAAIQQNLVQMIPSPGMDMKKLLAEAIEADRPDPALGKAANVLPRVHAYEPGPRWREQEEWEAIQQNLQQFAPSPGIDMKRLLTAALEAERSESRGGVEPVSSQWDDSPAEVPALTLTVALNRRVAHLTDPHRLAQPWLAGTGVPASSVLIVPAFNEEQSIGDILERVPRGRFRQIIVVDGGSVDRTAEVARSRGATVILEPAGYGAALLRGVAAVPDDIGAVMFLQADGSEDPAEAETLLEPIYSNRADLVVGSDRWAEHRASGNRLAALELILHHFKHPELASFRAIRFDALKRLDIQDRGFVWMLEMEVRALRQGLRLMELPVSCKGGARLRGRRTTPDWRVQTISEQLDITKLVRAAVQLLLPRPPLPDPKG